MSRTILAMTMGDPAGVGPEVCLKAIQSASRSVAIVLIGDADVCSKLCRASGLAMPPVADSLRSAIAILESDASTVAGLSVVLHVESLDGNWKPGVVSSATGAASYCYITEAIGAAVRGDVDGVVTGPIHKEALRLSGVPFPGHTEIFEALTKSQRACMMLTSDALTCSFVTTHIGLCDVPQAISIDRILDVIEMTEDAIRKIKGRPATLAVCGLNPHAGEGGLFGNREEELLISPAIKLARQKGINVDGPLPSDTAFLRSRREQTDAFVCMYHDQGHVPLKALSFDTAVNTTLGLPIVRTSVDHGTALDIAWQNFNADPTSMLQAILLAAKLSSKHVGVTP